MTYIVTDACIRCKYMDCIVVCPVDCFYEGSNMLVINPEECIDCGVCEPECPAGAIVADTVPNMEIWVARNQEYSKKWPNIRLKGTVPLDADTWLDVKDKWELHLDTAPGSSPNK